MKLVRAFLAGGAATIVDLVVLTILIAALGWPARVANVPALLVGGGVSFFANRHWVFRAREGSLSRQATLYVLVELVALALNGVLFDGAMRVASPLWYLPVRLVTSHLVFLAWSYPLWRLVFNGAGAPSGHRLRRPLPAQPNPRAGADETAASG